MTTIPTGWRAGAILSALVSAAGAFAAPADIRFHVTVLQPAGAVQPLLGGLDAKGHVAAGAILAGTSAEHALLFRNGRVVDLGTLGGGSSYATAVNDRDQVVGTSATATGAQHAFRWAKGAMTDLGALPGGIDFSQAQGVNRAGQVVGMSYLNASTPHAFLVDAGEMSDLGVLPGAVSSVASAINDAGHVAGHAGFADGSAHAFLLRGGVMSDLGTFGGAGAFSTATAINAHDLVVGAASKLSDTGAKVTTAVAWKQGVLTDLGMPDDAGALSSYARGVNDHGVVVGTFTRASVGGNPPQGAFIAFGGANRSLDDLLDADSVGWMVYSAMGVAEDGSVAAIVWNGSYQIALLTPVKPMAIGE